MTVRAPAPPLPAARHEQGPFDGRNGRWFLAFVVATVALGVVLRFWTTSDLWLDEALTANIAEHGLGDLVSLLEHDGAPPLYYVLLHGWTKVFGTSDVAIRSLSGALGLAALALCWPAAARLGGESRARRQWVAVAALVTIAASAYAVRYSTENRMYMLEVVLVLIGYLVLWRAIERPTFPALLGVAAVTAALLYTQYWSLYLVGVTGLGLAWVAWRGEPRGPARRALLAVAVGCGAFLPWIPTFLYQAEHTGTPWGTPTVPPSGISLTLTEFAGGFHFDGDLVKLVLWQLPLLALFGVAVSRRHIDIDLKTRPGVRWEWIGWGVTLVVGLTASYLSGNAFQSRYAAIVYPLFVLTVGYGITVFASRSVRYGLLVFIVVFSFAGAVRNVWENRSQGGAVAAAVNAESEPGDVVGYCPDQIAPDAFRLIDADVQQGVFPGFRRPDLVDWVDYEARNQAADPVAFAQDLVERAGPDGSIFYAYSAGYRTLDVKCEQIAQVLTTLRPDPDGLVADDGETFQHENLLRFGPREPTTP